MRESNSAAPPYPLEKGGQRAVRRAPLSVQSHDLHSPVAEPPRLYALARGP